MRNLSAMFETEVDARAARDRIVGEAGVAAGRVSIVDRSRTPGHGAAAPAKAAGSLWAQLKEIVALPGHGESHPTFAQAQERGGWLLTASVPEERLAQVMAIVERTGIPHLHGAEHELDGELSRLAPPTAARPVAPAGAAEQRIPLVEERLAVDREARAAGAVRVHTHAVERPVHERVVLRDYRVRIERRAAAEARPAADLEELFRERAVELTETTEEPVIAKAARVREELVIRREASERVEEVEGSVRRTEVDVERLAPSGRAADPR